MSEQKLKFRNGVSNIPHDDKKYKGGEDAWYASTNLIAMADGVGGWAEQGVDPAIFARQLCKNIGEIFSMKKEMTLKEVLIDSVKFNPH